MRTAASVVAAALVVVSCVEGPFGPGNQPDGTLSIGFTLPPGTPAVWLPAGDTLRVAIRRAGRADPIATTAVAVSGTPVESLAVPFSHSLESFVVTAEVAYSGAVYFLGFEAVRLRAGADTTVTIATRYVGPGARAATYALGLNAPMIRRGDTTSVVATVLDSLGQTIQNVPARYLSRRPTIVAVAPTGVVSAQQVPPDTARIAGYLPMGLGDSLVVTVLARAASLAPVSGDGQTALRLHSLAQPVTVRVLGDDGLPLAGEPVQFAADSADGSFSPPVVDTDANGEASSYWTLGARVGAQGASVSVPGVAPARVTATAGALPPDSIVVAPPTATLTALGSSRLLSATVYDSIGDPVTGHAFTWVSSSTGVATVSAAGLVTAVSAGTARITASLTATPTISGYSDVTVVGTGGAATEEIVFISTRDGNREVYVMEADGSGARRITTTPEDESFPAWSPDRTAIVFERELADTQIFRVAADGTGETQLTSVGNNTGPRFSPDGSTIAFTSDRAGSNEVWVMDASGAGQHRLVDPAGQSDQLGDWAPDGSAVVLIRKASDSADPAEAYVVDLTSGASSLAYGADDGEYPELLDARWSPIGGEILYTQNAFSGSAVILRSRTVDDYENGPLGFLASISSSFQGHAAFAAAGDVLVLEAETADGIGVYRRESDGSVTRLSPIGTDELEPDYVLPATPLYIDGFVATPSPVSATSEAQLLSLQASPRDFVGAPATVPVRWSIPTTGRLVSLGGSDVVAVAPGSATVGYTYGGWRSGSIDVSIALATGASARRLVFSANYQLYTMFADGTAAVPITSLGGTQNDPVYSPDGSRIAWTSYNDGDAEIWVMNADGSAQQQLTSNTVDDSYPSWSPDGQRIVFASNRAGGRLALWTMAADGSSPAQLTFPTTVDHVDPAWSPDGSLIAFTTFSGGATNLFTVPPQGGTPTALGLAGRYPSWTTGGDSLLFSAGTPSRIRRRALAGGTTTDLTTGCGSAYCALAGDYEPSVSSDGLILFWSTRNSSSYGQLHVMRADGTNQSGLVPVDDRTPNGFTFSSSGDWQPLAAPAWVASVVIGGDVVTPLQVSGTRQLTASALSSSGGAIVPAGGFVWTALDPARATVSATGVVTAVSAGTARIVLQSGIATPDTVTLTVDAPIVPTTRTWIGGTPGALTDWFTASNWSPAGVPNAVDTVRIVAAASGVVLAGDAAVTQVVIAGGSLTLNGNRLSVSGDFETGEGAGASGLLTMQNAADTLLVGGDATFAGSPLVGRLTAGVLLVAGDFSQVYVGSNWEAFQASGSHLTVLNGSAPQTVSFANPGTAGQTSFFQHLEVASTAGVTFSTNAGANGKLRVSAAATLSGAGAVTVVDSIVTVAGSSIATGGVRVGGGMSVSGAFSPGQTEFFGSGTVAQAGLAYQSVLVTGQVSLAGTTTFGGNLTIGRIVNQAAGNLTLAGQRLTVSGNLVIGQGGDAAGLLTMQDPADTLSVVGSATFSGSPMPGALTAGVLRVGGDFTQVYVGSNWESFQASGTHLTVLNGTGGQTVSFVNPGSSGQASFFQHLEVSNASGATFATNAVANGKLRVTVGEPLSGPGTVTVGDSLVTVAGSSITTGGMRLGGGMAVGGTFSPTLTELFGSGTVVQAGLAYQNVLVTGQVSLAGTTTFSNLIIGRLTNQPAGNLTLAGRKLTVTGDLTIGQGGDAAGLVTMQSAADTLVVGDDATFAGSPMTGALTAGVLLVGGDFRQVYVGSNWESFQASGTHRTVLNGGEQRVSFTNPGTSGQTSFFNLLDLAGSDAVRLESAVFANGPLRTPSAGTQLLTGPGYALTVSGLDVDGLTVDGATLRSTGGSLTRFDNVTFQNQDPTATQLTVEQAGLATPLVLTGLQFFTPPTTGYYVSATDTAPLDGNVLTVQLAASDPADGSARTLTAGGAVVTWLGAVVPPFTAINSGTNYGCGLAQSGKPFCWGQNFDGTVGDGTTMQRNRPTAVSGGLTLNVISTGAAHACGLTPAGAAYCWGSNGSGQLGDNSTTNSLVPVAVATGLAFTLISAGEQHTCARTAGGVVYCWGANGNGQLGDGTTTDRLVPTAVTGGLTFTTMGAGGSHTCAVTGAQAVYCWGANTFGQLGDNTGAQQTAPSPVSGGLTFDRVSVATSHTCALQANGVAYCWGWNGSGELGDGTQTASGVPVAVSGGLTFNSITTGGSGFTCGVTNSGAAYCWGLNDVGQLGDGSNTSRTGPVAVTGGVAVTSIDAGFSHVNAVAPSGAGYSWGSNGSGQLGDGTTSNRTAPVVILGP